MHIKVILLKQKYFFQNDNHYNFNCHRQNNFFFFIELSRCLL